MGRIRKDINRTLLSQESVNGDTTSDSLNLNDLEGAAIQLVFSNGSTFSGSVELEVSLDNTNFVPITDTSSNISGTDGVELWNLNNFHYSYVRMVFTHSGGSADFIVTCTGRARV